MNKCVTRIAATASLVAALLVPVTGAFASEHGVAQGQSHHGSVGRHGHGPQGRHGGDRHRAELEGVIVSIAPDSSSLVVRPPDTTAISATILISSSTIITADAGVTTTTLAIGEQVHIAARHDGSTLVAIRIDIQKLTADGGCHSSGNGEHRGAPSQGAGQGNHTHSAPAGTDQTDQAASCGQSQGGQGNGDNGGPGGGQGGQGSTQIGA